MAEWKFDHGLAGKGCARGGQGNLSDTYMGRASQEKIMGGLNQEKGGFLRGMFLLGMSWGNSIGPLNTQNTVWIGALFPFHRAVGSFWRWCLSGIEVAASLKNEQGESGARKLSLSTELPLTPKLPDQSGTVDYGGKGGVDHRHVCQRPVLFLYDPGWKKQDFSFESRDGLRISLMMPITEELGKRLLDFENRLDSHRSSRPNEIFMGLFDLYYQLYKNDPDGIRIIQTFT